MCVMSVIDHRTVRRFGQDFLIVLTEGCANDCAAYSAHWTQHNGSPEYVASHGEKLPVSDAASVFDLPEGKHWRV